MLFSSKKGGANALDSIHNYYERLVLETAQRSDSRCRTDNDFLADVACVALNHLPPRYIRHDVDTTFFLSPQELREIHDKVELAVKDAIQYVLSRDEERSNAAQDEDD